jgi:histone deacetylase 1/2
MAKVREHYRPDAVVLQCGADSLAGDKLGTHNTTIKGHGECVRFIKSWGLPLLILGGGGYTIKNVARCWAYETGLSVNYNKLDNNLPVNDYYEFYGPEYNLHFKPAEAQS